MKQKIHAFILGKRKLHLSSLYWPPIDKNIQQRKNNK